MIIPVCIGIIFGMNISPEDHILSQRRSSPPHLDKRLLQFASEDRNDLSETALKGMWDLVLEHADKSDRHPRGELAPIIRALVPRIAIHNDRWPMSAHYDRFSFKNGQIRNMILTIGLPAVEILLMQLYYYDHKLACYRLHRSLVISCLLDIYEDGGGEVEVVRARIAAFGKRFTGRHRENILAALDAPQLRE